MEELEAGNRFVDCQVVVVEEEVDHDREIPGYKRTALLVQSIANSIWDTVRMDIDCLSQHGSGWMPLLDLQVRLAEDNTIDYIQALY